MADRKRGVWLQNNEGGTGKMARRIEYGPMIDLWGVDFSLPNLTTPRAILAAQADYLELHSEGLLDADIETAVLDDRMAHAFTLRAAGLPKFRETLMTVTHGARLFPASVQSETLQEPVSCEDMIAYEATVRRILSARSTANLVRALLAQSRELELVRAEQREAAALNGKGPAGFSGGPERMRLN